MDAVLTAAGLARHGLVVFLRDFDVRAGFLAEFVDMVASARREYVCVQS